MNIKKVLLVNDDGIYHDAFKATIDALKKLGFDYIDEFDIWKYLGMKKWKSASDLLLYQMVDDIINVDNFVLADYYKNKKVDD